MIMSNEEIVREYRQSKKPLVQIGILADENTCSKREIVAILLEAGETVPKQFIPKPAAAVAPLPKEVLPGDPGWVRRGAVDAIARLLAESDQAKGAEMDYAACALREQVRGVLAMVYQLEGGDTDDGED